MLLAALWLVASGGLLWIIAACLAMLPTRSHQHTEATDAGEHHPAAWQSRRHPHQDSISAQ